MSVDVSSPFMIRGPPLSPLHASLPSLAAQSILSVILFSYSTLQSVFDTISNSTSLSTSEVSPSKEVRPLTVYGREKLLG